MMLPFSVCMSVYRNDKPECFREALDSVINQTVPPSELVVVVDGPVPEMINEVILELESISIKKKIIRLNENQGHAIARNTGIEHATYDMIALMDSDDIAESYRFERQLRCFEEDEMLSVLGGQIREFVKNPQSPIAIRQVPLTHDEIRIYLRSRCPMNQQTVMMRRADVLAAGGYLHWYCNEDYYLWIRMLRLGYKFANLPDILVNMRVGREMYARRGGWRYFKSEANLQKYMWQEGDIGFFRFCFNVCGRFVIQVMVSNSIRGFLFQKLFRKSK